VLVYRNSFLTFISHDGHLTSFIRAFDAGGMVWEGEDTYSTLDAAFAALDAALEQCLAELGIL